MRSKNIDINRNLAKQKQEQQAEKMVEESNKRFKQAEFGENVNVPIADVDLQCDSKQLSIMIVF